MPWLLAVFLNFNNLCESTNELHFSPAVQLDWLSSVVFRFFHPSMWTWWLLDRPFSCWHFIICFLSHILKYLSGLSVASSWAHYKHKLKIRSIVAHGRIYAWPLYVYMHLLWELWCAHVLTTPPREGCWQIKQHSHFTVQSKPSTVFFQESYWDCTCFLLWIQVLQDKKVSNSEDAYSWSGNDCFM